MGNSQQSLGKLNTRSPCRCLPTRGVSTSTRGRTVTEALPTRAPPFWGAGDSAVGRHSGMAPHPRVPGDKPDRLVPRGSIRVTWQWPSTGESPQGGRGAGEGTVRERGILCGGPRWHTPVADGRRVLTFAPAGTPGPAPADGAGLRGGQRRGAWRLCTPPTCPADVPSPAWASLTV